MRLGLAGPGHPSQYMEYDRYTNFDYKIVYIIITHALDPRQPRSNHSATTHIAANIQLRPCNPAPPNPRNPAPQPPPTNPRPHPARTRVLPPPPPLQTAPVFVPLPGLPTPVAARIPDPAPIRANLPDPQQHRVPPVTRVPAHRPLQPPVNRGNRGSGADLPE